MDKLPDEILLMIFEYLPKKELLSCSSVCTRWKCVSHDENLWKEIYLERVKISTTVLTNLVQRGVETLAVKFSTISDRAFWYGKQDYSTLKHLDLSFTSISPRSLFAILKDTRHLEQLTLWKCKLNVQICEAIGRNRDLQRLDLFGCDGVGPQEVAVILNNCCGIKCLNLAYTKLSVRTLDMMTSCLRPSIQSLDFLSYGLDTLVDRHMTEIVEACPNLQYLNIRCNTAVTQETDIAVRKLKFLKRYYR